MAVENVSENINEKVTYSQLFAIIDDLKSHTEEGQNVDISVTVDDNNLERILTLQVEGEPSVKPSKFRFKNPTEYDKEILPTLMAYASLNDEFEDWEINAPELGGEF